MGADFSVTRQQTTVIFSGSLTRDSVASVLDEFNRSSTQKLLVSSSGGDVSASLALGRVVNSLALDVEVQGLCMSSCANYIFPAGRRKRIADGAIVVWHGSAMQKDFRTLVAKWDDIQSLPEGKRTTEQEIWLASFAAPAKALVTQQKEQAAFFSAIGVDEQITRLGQEPIALSQAWTTTPDTMAHFGIGNVEFPVGYGTPQYMEIWKKVITQETLSTLHYDPRTREIFKVEPR